MLTRKGWVQSINTTLDTRPHNNSQGKRIILNKMSKTNKASKGYDAMQQRNSIMILLY